MAKDPLEANRAQLLKLLLDKSALKQDIADDCEKVFETFKEKIKIELETLQKSITDPRIRLNFVDKGKFEIHVYIGSDVLVFNLHQNVFRLPDHNPLWGTSYFNKNENNGYFGIINVYNFLAESFLQNRMDDRGYLIGRIFINHERHFMIEGKGSIGAHFRDPQHLLLNEQLTGVIVQMVFAYALQFDLYIPPFEYYSEVSVAQIQYIGETLKLQTAKRLGFKMSADDSEIF
jgi:hypothetical protein